MLKPTSFCRLIVYAFLTTGISLWAQSSAEFEVFKPYGAYHAGEIDTISLVNGALQLNIPLWSYSQRGGKLRMDFAIRYIPPTYVDTSPCQPVPPATTCMQRYKLGFTPGSPGVYIRPSTAYQGEQHFVQDAPGDPIIGSYFVFQEPDGSRHEMGGIGNGQARALDDSGFLFDVNASILTDKEGTHYFFPNPDNRFFGPPTKIEDANGNRMELGTVNGISGWLDTLGRLIPVAGANTTDFTGCNGPLPVVSAKILSLPGPNGGTLQFKTCFASIHILTNFFNQWSFPPANRTKFDIDQNLNMLQNVVLANGTSLTFQYGPTDQTAINYGNLTQITLPTGGTVSYAWAVGHICTNDAAFPVTRVPFVRTRQVDPNDGTGSKTWTYSFPGQNGDYLTRTWTNKITDPVGNDSLHTITGLNGTCSYYETQAQYFLGQSSGNQLLKTETTQYAFHSDPNNDGFTLLNDVIDVHPMQKVTIWPNGTETQQTMSYDSGFSFLGYQASPGTASYGNLTSTQIFDYTTSLPGTLLKTVKIDYRALSDSTYLNANNVNRLNLVSQLAAFAGASATGACGANGAAACATYGYDETALVGSGITTELNTSPLNGAKRGNQTSVHSWLKGSTTATANCNVSVSNGFLVSNKTYFDTGEVLQSADPCGHATNFQYSSTYVGAFPTTVTNPLSQNTIFAYDFNTGAVTSITDANSQTTTKNYDIMARPISVSFPGGGSTTYCYTDMGGSGCIQSGPPYSMVTTTAITSSPTVLNKIETAVFDGLGRLSQTELNSDTPSATYAQITYDALGRKLKVYNPTRCNPLTTNCGETTWGFTTFNYDGLGRVWNQWQPDGSAINRQFALVNNQYCTTIWDEASKVHGECLDGLARLVSLFEDQPGLNYGTFYQYDALGNLTCVEQHGNSSSGTGCSSTPSNDATSPWRVRRFTYDSLSRLLTASNPESGTTTYTYDANGNVITKTAPLANQTGTSTVTTTYTYDVLNRLTSKSYNDGKTAKALFAYDGNTLSGCSAQAPPGDTDSFPIGRRTAMCDVSGGTNWTHDQMGRVLQERRTIGSVSAVNVTNAYNVDGSLASLTSVNYLTSYTYNGAGRPIAVKSSTSGTTYVASANYAPFGGLISAALGTAPITVTNTYNSRQQPTLISAAAASTIMSLCYDFHSATAISSSPCSFATNSTGDNGNVFRVVNNRDNNRSQNFLYDSLNRISQVYSTGSNWGETFGPTATNPGVQPTSPGIDAWGNLTNRSGVTGKSLTEGWSTSATVKNQLTGFGYDAAGNMTSNGSATYVYDAENRLIATGGMSYVYDGDGRRVKKCTEGTTAGTCASGATGTLYWTVAGHDTTRESDLSNNPIAHYIFFNDRRIARHDTSGNVHFYFSDHLGTHSLVTDANGTMPPQDESDFFPYGGEIVITNNDPNRYKFTGKERDSESGLDNFGARYNAMSLGRFMTPDLVGGHLQDPQTLNKYAYVRNSPTTLTDPTGLDFYLSCQKASDTCRKDLAGNLVQGTTTKTTDANGNITSTFNPIVVTSASLQDPNSGNTGTVNQNGVQITSNGQTSEGIFINGTPAADLKGSGALEGFLFNVNGSDEKTGNLDFGSYVYTGSRNQSDVGKLLGDRGAFTYGPEKLFGNYHHEGEFNFRFSSGAHPNLLNYGPSLHLLVSQDPRATVPVGPGYKGNFHVDSKTGPQHLACAEKGIGCTD
jgi:RHS repeat-associated protein